MWLRVMQIKKYIGDALNKIPILNKYFSGIATIFMLHRVSPIDKNRLSPNEHLKVSPEFLDRFIEELKNKGVKFVSLDELYEIIYNYQKPDKYLVVFTLDDGYKDNYEIAYPIFKKHNVPFTIYVSPSLIEGNTVAWWYILENLILENERIELSNGLIFNTRTKTEKEDAFLRIREIILTERDNLLTRLNELFDKYNIDWSSENKKLFMNWEQIIELSKDSLCTIGNHTKNHYNLKQLAESQVIGEILEGNRLIESKINKKVVHFAYPFGSSNEVGIREVEIVRRLGFKTAVTAIRGTIYPEHKNHLCCLPRIMLTENFNFDDVGRIRKKKIITL